MGRECAGGMGGDEAFCGCWLLVVGGVVGVGGFGWVQGNTLQSTPDISDSNPNTSYHPTMLVTCKREDWLGIKVQVSPPPTNIKCLWRRPLENVKSRELFFKKNDTEPSLLLFKSDAASHPSASISTPKMRQVPQLQAANIANRLLAWHSPHQC